MDLNQQLELDGFALLPALLSAGEVAELIAAVEAAEGFRRGGMRRVAERVPAVAALSRSRAIRNAVEAVLGPDVTLARSLLFDKTPAGNWNVAWHQDVTIAVRERLDALGFSAWSVKDGVPHVQPPDEVLARVLAVRVHLDDCGPDNGALRVLPGSHAHGRLSEEAVDAWRARVPERVCAARAGDALLMRPLLLHASSAAVRPAHRRVIQLEFGRGG
ncbi:MAG: phytanoyl-CoA dioxygenase family protein, partial [Actinomycetota bacterium]